jgi:hypothetical protein
MINLCCAVFERKRDVIQKVVGGTSKILSKRSSYGSFALILNYGTSESAEHPEAGNERA